MNIGRGVDLALMLGQAQAIGIPAQRPLARGGIDRQASEVDQFRTLSAFRAVLVKGGPPDAGEIHLSKRRNADQGEQRQKSSHVSSLWYILCETHASIHLV